MSGDGDYVESYYARTATGGGPRPALAGVVSTDTCVIGGGLAGLSTALELAERGRDVVLLEARRAGWGASGRNGGFVGPGFSVGARTLERRLGPARARALYDLSRGGVEIVRARIARHRIECGPVVDGTLSVSWFDDAADLERERDHMAARFDAVAEVWPRERVHEALVSERYHGGLFHPQSFQIHPLNYSRGLADALEARGARVHEGSPVLGVDDAGAERRVRTPGGEVRARNVVFTCGGYLDGLNRRLWSAVVPVATYVVATAPLGEERLRSAIRVPHGISDRRFANDYYRATADTRILWGGRISVRRSRPPDLARFMLRDLLRVYPQLEGVRVESAWHGLMSYAAHKMPQIGRLGDGLWYAMGFGGHGLNTTAMAGELLGSAIAEGDERYRMFSPFGLVPVAGPVGAAAAQLTYWWYQLRDARRAARAGG